MPFARPGLTDLRDAAVQDILVGTGLPTLLRRSPLRALAYAQAGLAYGQYGYIDWIARQAVPFTATGAFLEAWAALVGVTRKGASRAKGLAVFRGTPGVIVPVGTILRRGDGESYATQAACVIGSGGTGSVAILSTDAGSRWSLTTGTPMTLAAPVSGVLSAATGNPATPGADQETDDALRTRMLLRWSKPPQGGAARDYLEWALAVPGVTRAWVRPRGMGPGTVQIFTMWDAAESTNGGFPQGTSGVAPEDDRDAAATGDLATLASAIYPQQPVTALVYATAPVPAPVTVAITTRTAVSAALQAEVEAAMDAVFLQLADPLGGTWSTSPLVRAIADALGNSDFTLTAPLLSVHAPVGQLPVRGTTKWIATNG